MIREVKAGKTLLVNGPASVYLVSGEAKILGAPLKIGETIVIRDGKRAPFYVMKESSFYIKHTRGSVIEETDGNTVPASWQSAVEKTLSMEKPGTVMIIDDVDSGKTSLCTFLVNKENKILGLGIILSIDYRRKILKVSTSVTQEVATIRVGNVRLDDAYQEIGTGTL